MKLTLTFYQFPQAQAEIDFWADSQKDRITGRSSNSETKEQVFYLPGEVLVCLPINDGKGFTGLDTRHIFRWLHKHKYHKTLVFGQINFSQSMKLSPILHYLENAK